MPEVNLWAVLACGVGSLLLGGLWYAPPVFAKPWQREAGLTDERLKAGNMPMIFGVAFLLSLFAAYAFGTLIGPGMSLGLSIHAGLAAGLCWVGAAFGINYLFERRSLKLWLINAGYHMFQFTMFGLIFGLMR